MSMIRSSLSAHFGTNYIPSCYDLYQIRANISALDNVLGWKRAEFESIMARRAAAAHELAEWRALASPMRRVPPNILREIFLYCLPTAHNALISPKSAPTLLTHICSAWRSLALNTPMLWASIHFPVPSVPLAYAAISTSGRPEKAAAEIARKEEIVVREWLARSGACPLSISFYEGNRDDITDAPTKVSMFGSLLPLSRRWKSLMAVTSSQILERLAGLTMYDAPYLEHVALDLTITAGYGMMDLSALDSSALDAWQNSSFLAAPRLRSVSFVNVSQDIFGLPLRWHQLTKLSVEGIVAKNMSHITVKDTATLLARCPHLQEARFELFSPMHLPPIGPFYNGGAPQNDMCTHSLFLPHLTSLSFHTSGSDLGSLFMHMYTPALARFEYHTPTIGPDIGAVYAYVASVAETLRCLVTNLAKFGEADFMQLLHSVPGLTELRCTHKHTESVYVMERFGNEMPGLLEWFDDEFLGRLVGRSIGACAGSRQGEHNGKGRAVDPPHQQVQPQADASDDSDSSSDSDSEDSMDWDYSRLVSSNPQYYGQFPTWYVGPAYNLLFHNVFHDGGALLPRLQILESQFPVACTDGGILEFLQLRQARALSDTASTVGNNMREDLDPFGNTALTPLRVLSFTLERDQMQPIREALIPVIEAGLQLNLVYRRPRQWTFTVECKFSPAGGIGAFSDS